MEGKEDDDKRNPVKILEGAPTGNLSVLKKGCEVKRVEKVSKEFYRECAGRGNPKQKRHTGSIKRAF